MDVMASLAACDWVSVPLLVAVASDSAGSLSPTLQYATKICLSKTPGHLRLKLDVSDLILEFGYPSTPGVNVELDGVQVGQDEHGNPLIEWSTDTAVSQSVGDAVIRRVKGAIRTSVLALVPSVSALACGQQRTFIVALKSHGAASDRLSVDVTYSILGRAYDNTLTISDVAMTAKAGLALAPGVRIQPRAHTLCPPKLWVEGKALTLRALPSGLPPGWIESYAWTLSGAVATGPVNDSRLELQLPSPPRPVEIVLSMSTADITVTDKIAFTPLAQQEADAIDGVLALLCRLRGEVIRNRFFDPLWDPLRQIDRGRIPTMELHRLSTGMARIAALSSELSETATRLAVRARDH